MAESNPVIPFPHPTAADFIGTDDDVHGFKSQGRGDLSKTNSFEDPQSSFQEYPKHIVKDGKTYTVAAEDAEPVLLVAPDEPPTEPHPDRIEDSPLACADAIGDQEVENTGLPSAADLDAAAAEQAIAEATAANAEKGAE